MKYNTNSIRQYSILIFLLAFIGLLVITAFILNSRLHPSTPSTSLSLSFPTIKVHSNFAKIPIHNSTIDASKIDTLLTELQISSEQPSFALFSDNTKHSPVSVVIFFEDINQLTAEQIGKLRLPTKSNNLFVSAYAAELSDINPKEIHYKIYLHADLFKYDDNLRIQQKANREFFSLIFEAIVGSFSQHQQLYDSARQNLFPKDGNQFTFFELTPNNPASSQSKLHQPTIAQQIISKFFMAIYPPQTAQMVLADYCSGGYFCGSNYPSCYCDGDSSDTCTHAQWGDSCGAFIGGIQIGTCECNVVCEADPGQYHSCLNSSQYYCSNHGSQCSECIPSSSDTCHWNISTPPPPGSSPTPVPPVNPIDCGQPCTQNSECASNICSDSYHICACGGNGGGHTSCTVPQFANGYSVYSFWDQDYITFNVDARNNNYWNPTVWVRLNYGTVGDMDGECTTGNNNRSCTVDISRMNNIRAGETVTAHVRIEDPPSEVSDCYTTFTIPPPTRSCNQVCHNDNYCTSVASHTCWGEEPATTSDFREYTSGDAAYGAILSTGTSAFQALAFRNDSSTTNRQFLLRDNQAYYRDLNYNNATFGNFNNLSVDYANFNNISINQILGFDVLQAETSPNNNAYNGQYRWLATNNQIYQRTPPANAWTALNPQNVGPGNLPGSGFPTAFSYIPVNISQITGIATNSVDSNNTNNLNHWPPSQLFLSTANNIYVSTITNTLHAHYGPWNALPASHGYLAQTGTGPIRAIDHSSEPGLDYFYIIRGDPDNQRLYVHQQSRNNTGVGACRDNNNLSDRYCSPPPPAPPTCTLNNMQINNGTSWTNVTATPITTVDVSESNFSYLTQSNNKIRFALSTTNGGTIQEVSLNGAIIPNYQLEIPATNTYSIPYTVSNLAQNQPLYIQVEVTNGNPTTGTCALNRQINFRGEFTAYVRNRDQGDTFNPPAQYCSPISDTILSNIDSADFNLNTSSTSNPYTIQSYLGNNLIIAPPPGYASVCPDSGTYSLNDINLVNQDLYFYLERDQGAWWQTAFGDVLANQNITGTIPFTCANDTTCQEYLSLANGTQEAGVFINGSSSNTTSGDTNTYLRLDGTTPAPAPAWTASSDYNPPTSEKEDYDYFAALTNLDTSGDDFTGIDTNHENIPTDTGVNVYYAGNNNDLTINPQNNSETWNTANSQQFVIFVNGNLNINANSSVTDPIIRVANGGFLAFIVNGDININGNIGDPLPANPIDATSIDSHLEGVYIANGSINTGSGTNTLVGEGIFVGWQQINLDRNYGDIANNTSPAMIFRYRPDLLLNTPEILKNYRLTWKEVAPRVLPTP